MINFPSPWRAFAAGVLLVALASCGDDSGDEGSEPATDTTAQTGGAGATDVLINDFAFISADVTVDVGTAVTWRNDQSVEHTVTGDDEEFDSANLPEGASFTQTFEEPGTFTYHCEIHPSMTGTINVQG